MMGAAASKATASDRHQTHPEHASRTPICLNLKEIDCIAQVVRSEHFDLRYWANYLKLESTG
jgi:hypothetical protein